MITEQHLRDLGTFMLACVMLWAYTSFSQLLIIWSANLPEEITWYITRLEGGWEYVGYGLLVFHFAVPFLFLISSTMKSKTKLLATIAAGLIFMALGRFVLDHGTGLHQSPRRKGTELPQHRDHPTLARPSHSNRHRRHRLGAFLRAQLKKRALIAQNDPRFADLYSGESNHG